jgi:hypothetical protein
MPGAERLMRPQFLDTPEAWTRAQRRSTDPVRDACALEGFARRVSRRERLAGDALAVAIALALVALALNEMGALL